MADKPIQLVNGKQTEVEATVVSTGVGEAGDVVALDPSGKLDPSVLPTGIGADVAVLPSTENLSAGDYVNIFDDGGTPSVRLADSTNGRDAHGFVTEVVTAPANATIFFEGSNANLSGLTAGDRQYLDAAGAPTNVPPSTAGGDTISQFLGIAVNATTINTDIDDCVLLA